MKSLVRSHQRVLWCSLTSLCCGLLAGHNA